MAAVTPSSVVRESMGSLTLHIATFASVDSSTWASGLPNAIAWWAVPTGNAACGALSVTATSTGTTGTTFTIGTRLAASAIKLYVASRT